MKLLKTIYKKIDFKKRKINHKYASIISHDLKTNGEITLIDRVKIAPNCYIGKFSYIHSGYLDSNTSIGSFCSISRNVQIAGSEHPMNRLTSSPVTYTNSYFSDNVLNQLPFVESDLLQTVIGNDVWIGANVIVKRGVKIGNSCVIGAGSVVTKDIPDFSVVAGVPAKVIKERIIQREMAIEFGDWWEKDLNEIPWEKSYNFTSSK